jgi:hypothetical protein
MADPWTGGELEMRGPAGGSRLGEGGLGRRWLLGVGERVGRNSGGARTTPTNSPSRPLGSRWHQRLFGAERTQAEGATAGVTDLWRGRSDR